MKDSNTRAPLIYLYNKCSLRRFFFDSSVNLCYYCDSFVT